MQVTIHRIKRLTYEKVTFYTVQIDGNNHEFEDFKKRLCTVRNCRPLLGRLFQIIEGMGLEHGAKEYFFKNYSAAGNERADKKGHVSYIEVQLGKFVLILYCLRISDSIVILLNGDIKTSSYLEKCNTKNYYELTSKLFQNLEDAILRAKNVDIQTGLIQLADNTPLTIL